jgi:DNA-cytosine methyltransferase
MKVLSLFDGISGTQVALRNLGVIPTQYDAVEINKHSIAITQHNFPNTRQLGDIRTAQVDSYYDLIVFGSPCTDLSIGKKGRQGLLGKQSSLFYEALGILGKTKYKHFMMENVASMSEGSRGEISDMLGVQPVEVNSNRFLPQSRRRLYWCNWTIPALPKPTTRRFESLLFDSRMEHDDFWYWHYSLSKAGKEYMDRQVKGGRNHWDFGHHSDTQYQDSACIISNFKKGVPYNVLIDRRNEKTNSYGPWIRKFDPMECERLQGFPDDYTNVVAKTHRFEAIGNSFTVPAAGHVLSAII